MNFKTWISENLTDSPQPLGNLYRGSDAIASSEVIRTGLQPQVDGDKIATPEKAEQKDLDQLEDLLSKVDNALPYSTGERVNKFKTMWYQFRTDWENSKRYHGLTQEVPIKGLAGERGDQATGTNMDGNPDLHPHAPTISTIMPLPI